MKVIVIEGLDNVGKDTIINRLQSEFQTTIIEHCSKPKSETPEEQAIEKRQDDIKNMGNALYFAVNEKNNDNIALIFNRSWYGEYVYGCMYRNNNPENVKRDILTIEYCLNAVIDKNDIYFITLLSDNADFLIKNEDGLSLSKAKKELIEEETNRFKEIYNFSTIKNKHIIYVNDNDKFRDREDIYNEIINYIK